jgi:transaldolase
MTHPLDQLKIKIFADGADKAGMIELHADPLIKGMTTNPTEMKKAGVRDYEAFAREVLETVREKPISFEVFSDDFSEMRRQALKIRGWGENVFVKIPITNTRGESSLSLVRELVREGVKVNVTAILTLDQVRGATETLDAEVPSIISVFSGRIADSGRDPCPMLRESRRMIRACSKSELLWASVREILNIFQAEACGCDIVTVPHDILRKAMRLCGIDLVVFSLDTVKMFADDAAAAGYTL